MEIKVGDYVRTIHGEIAIFKGWNNNSKSQWNCKLEFQKIKTWKYCCEEYIKAHSPNIIDLIEIGDYVNGFQVFKTNKQSYLDYAVMVIDGAEDGTYVFEDEIKSIVTHEQFKEMEYEV